MKLVFILSLLVGFILTVRCDIDRSVCPAKVRMFKYLHLYANMCVIFIPDKMSWDSARSNCRRLGGDLVMIKDSDKQKYILDSLKEDHWNQDQIWIGANDKHHEGDWRWVDGTKVSYQHFASGQGNNHNHGGFLFASGSPEDCALIRRGDGGNWHDYPCSPPVLGIGYKYSFACEFQAKLQSLTQMLTTTSSPLNATTMANVETPGPTTQMPNVETPAPTTQMPNVETPAPTTQMPNVETPVPTTQMPNVETPAPTTQMPNVETPAPTTQMPNVETPEPTFANVETPLPTAIIGKRRKL